MVVQNISNTLQGITQLEQTKSDRQLNDTIAIVGVGLGISGLTATVATQYIPAPKQYPKAYDFTDLTIFFSPAFLLSILVSAPFVVALIYRLLRR